MAAVQYDLDTSGGLMTQIQELIAPPVLEDSGTKPKKKEKRNKRPGRAVNHDFCDSCKEGGDLICCDRCPAAFHYNCYDPPLSEDDLPSGEWLCNRCKCALEANAPSTSGSAVLPSHGSSSQETDPSLGPLEQLINFAFASNAAQFEMPSQLACSLQFPGSSRKPRPKENKNKKAATHEYIAGLSHLPNNLCYYCKKSCRHAPLIQCDYCPLLFHADCLDPPLTSLPTSRWMCPNHAQHLLDQKVLASISLTERVKLWDKFNGPVEQDAVKLGFLNKLNQPNPPFRHKVKLPPRKKMRVPYQMGKQYTARRLLLPRVRDPIPSNIVINSCKEPEVTKWLGQLVKFQTELVTHELEQFESTKVSPQYQMGPDDIHCQPVIIDPSLIQKKQGISQSKASFGAEGCSFQPVKIKLEDNRQPVSSKVQFTKSASKVSVDIGHSSQGFFVKPGGQGRSSDNVTSVPNYGPKKESLLDDAYLNKMDDKLVRLYAYKYIKLIETNKKKEIKDENKSESKEIRARAVLVPLDVIHEPVPMTYRVMHLGLGDEMEVCFSKFGYCVNVSPKHATIFFDEFSKQYELLNYSAFGTIVDNVLYGIDISDKPSTAPVSTTITTAIRRLRCNTPRLQNSTAQSSIEPPQEKQPVEPQCRCKGKPADGCETSYEGSALLHHGSLIQCGCLQFVFSVTEYGYIFQKQPFPGSSTTVKIE